MRPHSAAPKETRTRRRTLSSRINLDLVLQTRSKKFKTWDEFYAAYDDVKVLDGRPNGCLPHPTRSNGNHMSSSSCSDSEDERLVEKDVVECRIGTEKEPILTKCMRGILAIGPIMERKRLPIYTSCCFDRVTLLQCNCGRTIKREMFGFHTRSVHRPKSKVGGVVHNGVPPRTDKEKPSIMNGLNGEHRKEAVKEPKLESPKAEGPSRPSSSAERRGVDNNGELLNSVYKSLPPKEGLKMKFLRVPPPSEEKISDHLRQPLQPLSLPSPSSPSDLPRPMLSPREQRAQHRQEQRTKPGPIPIRMLGPPPIRRSLPPPQYPVSVVHHPPRPSLPPPRIRPSHPLPLSINRVPDPVKEEEVITLSDSPPSSPAPPRQQFILRQHLPPGAVPGQQPQPRYAQVVPIRRQGGPQGQQQVFLLVRHGSQQNAVRIQTPQHPMQLAHAPPSGHVQRQQIRVLLPNQSPHGASQYIVVPNNSVPRAVHMGGPSPVQYHQPAGALPPRVQTGHGGRLHDLLRQGATPPHPRPQNTHIIQALSRSPSASNSPPMPVLRSELFGGGVATSVPSPLVTSSTGNGTPPSAHVETAEAKETTTKVAQVVVKQEMGEEVMESDDDMPVLSAECHSTFDEDRAEGEEMEMETLHPCDSSTGPADN